MIFLDAEFTSSTQEVLELCITNEHGTVLFHSYFKPRRARSWMLEPHHISPKQVRHAPYFSRLLPQVQRIISQADMVGGFAVDNDVRHLEAEGVDFSASNMLELREMYWALRNGCEDIDPYKIPGLTACATSLGVEVNPDTEHSAKGDTLVTTRLYHALAEALPQYPWDASPQEAWRQCHAYFQEGIVDFQREHARGFVWLKPLTPGHYKLVAKTIEPPEGEAAACIAVADRHRAVYEIRKKFRQRQTHAGYSLREADLEWFGKYTNAYDPVGSGVYKKLAASAAADPSAPAEPKPKPKPKPKQARRRRRGQKPNPAPTKQQAQAQDHSAPQNKDKAQSQEQNQSQSQGRQKGHAHRQRHRRRNKN